LELSVFVQKVAPRLASSALAEPAFGTSLAYNAEAATKYLREVGTALQTQCPPNGKADYYETGGHIVQFGKAVEGSWLVLIGTDCIIKNGHTIGCSCSIHCDYWIYRFRYLPQSCAQDELERFRNLL
jgi:hypothetical protein